MRTKKPVHVRAALIIVNIAAISGALVAVLALVAMFFGVRPLIFLTGSMSPHIRAGALALAAPVSGDQIEVGEVISTVRADGLRVTHRAVAIDEVQGEWHLRMQGDANMGPDTETYVVDETTRRVFWHANGLGRVVGEMGGTWAILGAGGLAALALIPTKRDDTKNASSETNFGAGRRDVA